MLVDIKDDRFPGDLWFKLSDVVGVDHSTGITQAYYGSASISRKNTDEACLKIFDALTREEQEKLEDLACDTEVTYEERDL